MTHTKYKNKKNGKIYIVVNHAINTTNKQDGQTMYIYHEEGKPTSLFCRCIDEFNKKFSLVLPANAKDLKKSEK